MISFTTSPIFWAALARLVMVALVRLASSTALPEMRVDSSTCRLISLTELESSSVAEATVWTLAVA